jgi:hypothetical protein
MNTNIYCQFPVHRNDANIVKQLQLREKTFLKAQKSNKNPQQQTLEKYSRIRMKHSLKQEIISTIIISDRIRETRDEESKGLQMRQIINTQN